MIADFKPYPAYKDSGVEWLGEVPEHWTTERLKSSMNNIVEQTAGRQGTDLYVALEHVESWTGRLRHAGFDVSFDSQVKYFRSGDVLFGKLRPYLAKVTRPTSDGVCVGEFLVLRPRYSNATASYMEQLLRSKPIIDAVNSSTFGAKMPRADWQFMGGMAVALPSLSEQAAIVRFLDYADRRIRRYIRAKQKLITLLEEQKQALIHQSVTGQIDVRTGQSYPAYKPSGVEWLGEVPEHWEVRRCGGVFREVVDTGYTDAELLSIDRFVGVVRQSETGRKQRASEDRSTYKRVRPGQLAYNLMNAFMGSIGVSALDGILSPAYAVAEPLGQIDTCFFHHLLRTPLYTGQFYRYSYGIMYERNRLYFNQFKQISMLVPPYVEQQAIGVALTAASAEFSRRLECLDRQIELVTEYRTRLIADVVTGNLDVREAAAHLPDEADEPEPVDEDTGPIEQGLTAPSNVTTLS